MKIFIEKYKNYLLGLSGGMDSVGLFHYLRTNNIKFSCVHVVHGDTEFHKQSENFVKDLCQKYNIDLVIRKINLSENDKPTENNLRNHRHKIFVEVLEEKDLDAILLAHHLDDQIETLFLKLMRGSGIRGLRGMTFTSKSPFDKKSIVVRPFIKVSRQEIKEFLNSLGFTNKDRLDWVDDPTNNDFKNNDRNYIRHKIVPLFKERWGNFYESVRNTIDSLNDDAVALDFELKPRKSIGLGYLLNKPDECIYSYIMNVYSSWGNKKPTRKQIIEFVKQLRQKNIQNIHPQLLVGNIKMKKVKNTIDVEFLDEKNKIKNINTKKQKEVA